MSLTYTIKDPWNENYGILFAPKSQCDVHSEKSQQPVTSVTLPQRGPEKECLCCSMDLD
jgi:hypothetical protein